MAFTIGVSPITFERRFSGNMEPPVYEFPVSDTATVFRKGNIILAASSGKAVLGTGAAGAVPGTGVALSTADNGLLGFFWAGTASAPQFPTSAGVQGSWTSPAAVTANDPIPAGEYVSVVLALPDCIFGGNFGTSAAAVEADYATSDRTSLLVREGLAAATVAAQNNVAFVDVSGTANIVQPIAYKYPQTRPQARSTTGVVDPWLLAGTTVTNARVEFHLIATYWSPLS